MACTDTTSPVPLCLYDGRNITYPTRNQKIRAEMHVAEGYPQVEFLAESG